MYHECNKPHTACFSRVSPSSGEKHCEKASIDEAFVDVTQFAEHLLATGMLPAQFDPPAGSKPQRWCATGWLRRSPHKACHICDCEARAALEAQGYRDVSGRTVSRSEESDGVRRAPDGSAFFCPPSPAQRWALKRAASGTSVATVASVDAAAKCTGLSEMDSTTSDQPAGGRKSGERAAAYADVAALWADVCSRGLAPTAADCVFAVQAFAAASRWHVLDDAGKNGTQPSLMPSLATPLGVRLCAGALIAECIRRIIFEELNLTCSAGVAHNKMLAKLASARNKPNQQTLVPATCVPGIMRGLPLGKIRGLGGKLGAALCAAASAATASTIAANVLVTSYAATAPVLKQADSDGHALDAYAPPMSGDNDDASDGYADSESENDDHHAEGEDRAAPTAASGHAASTVVTAGAAQQLSFNLISSLAGGEERASAVYRLLRGIDDSAITPRSKPKQLSAGKSFSTKTCATFRDACQWLRMLCAEIDGRMSEDVALFARVPSTISLHYAREGGSGRGVWHSKSAQLQRSSVAAGGGLMAQAVDLLRGACADEGVSLVKSSVAPATEEAASVETPEWARWRGSFFPCSHLSLSVAGFIDLHAGMAGSARAMEAFLASSKTSVTSEATIGHKRLRPEERASPIVAALQRQVALQGAATQQVVDWLGPADGSGSTTTSNGAVSARTNPVAPRPHFRQAELGRHFRVAGTSSPVQADAKELPRASHATGTRGAGSSGASVALPKTDVPVVDLVSTDDEAIAST